MKDSELPSLKDAPCISKNGLKAVMQRLSQIDLEASLVSLSEHAPHWAIEGTGVHHSNTRHGE